MHHFIFEHFHLQEADIALNILSMTSARRRAIRFTAPIAHGHFAIFTRVPTIDQKTTAYILPFQNDVWFVIIATILILPAALLVSFCCIRVSIPSVDFMQFFVPKYAGLPTITGNRSTFLLFNSIKLCLRKILSHRIFGAQGTFYIPRNIANVNYVDSHALYISLYFFPNASCVSTAF